LVQESCCPDDSIIYCLHLLFAYGHNQNPVASKFRLEALPKELEIHLALSAAPRHLRAGATVYMLDPAKGYILERKGQRTDYRREDFRNDLIVPECQDPEGSRTIAPVEFEIEHLRLEAKTRSTTVEARD